MNSGIYYQGQSLFDKTIETTGDIEQSFALALLNGASVTDEFAIEQEIVFLTAPKRKSVVALFHSKNRPASDLVAQDRDIIVRGGIGKMIIESTFIVG